MKKKSKLMRGFRALVPAGMILLIFTGAPCFGATIDVYLQAGVTTIPANTFSNPEPITMWGFALCDSTFSTCGQTTVPGPILTATEGDTLNIHVKNNLTPPASFPAMITEPTSIIVPGQVPVGGQSTPTWTDGTTGPRTSPGQRVRSFATETPVGGTAVYTWPNVKAGTYLYQSGTHPAVQIQMGLYGPLKVYPATAGQAYNDPSTAYNTEVTIVYSEIDPELHYSIASGNYGTPQLAPPAPPIRGRMTSTIDYRPQYFAINGLPYVPGSSPSFAAFINQRVLIRFLNAGLLEKTPTLKNHYMTLIAEDGNLLPYPKEQYSVLLPAGKTMDAVFTPAEIGDIPIYDRSLNLTNSASSPGGMLAYLQIFPSPIPLITHYYNTILGRAPDAGGLAFWVSEIERVVSLGIDIKEGFISLGKLFFNSAEYLARNRNDTQYITDLYQTFLGRAPDAPGLAFWVGYLTQGSSRNEVLNFFVFSPEFNLHMQAIFGAVITRPENNLVNDFSRGLLSRLPDTAGFYSLLGLMRNAQCMGAQAVTDLSSQIALGFVNSVEYALRNRNNSGYVEDLYDAILRRGASPTEVNGWVSLLNAGVTRDQVLQAFTSSAEFQSRVQGVIAAGCLP